MENILDVIYLDFFPSKRAVSTLDAHDSPVAAMAFNLQGNWIATASGKVWNSSENIPTSTLFLYSSNVL